MRKLDRVIKRLGLARLSSVDAGELPSEFLIFKPGENATTKGTFVFDEEAAARVMAAYAEHGVDVAIDLEHFSLPDENDNVKDPDARGWCNLELRSGSLWAVNVRWTPDGERRLRERRQRYISPAFAFNKDNGQILALYNIAICAIPAAHEAPALVAASKRAGKNVVTLSIGVKKMDFLKMVCAALGLGEDTTQEDALKAIKALADDGDGESEEEKKKKEEAADEPKDEEKMAAQLARLGPKTKGVVLASLAARPALEARLATLEAAQKTSEREALLVANVKKIPLHLEKWARDPATDLATLKTYFANAIEQPRAKTEPAGGNGSGTETVELTSEDREMAKLSGMPLADVLAHKKKKADEAKLARG